MKAPRARSHMSRGPSGPLELRPRATRCGRCTRAARRRRERASTTGRQRSNGTRRSPLRRCPHARAGTLRGLAGMPRVPRAGVYEVGVDGHGANVQSLRSTDVIGDFSGTQTCRISARAVSDGTRHFIEIRRGDNEEWVRYPVDYVIGSKWQQAYATRLPDSRLLVFPIQYSRAAIGVGELLGHRRRARLAAHRHCAVSRASGRCRVSDDLRAVSHESVVLSRRAPPNPQPRRSAKGHQLRDVPWAVARSRRAAEGRRSSPPLQRDAPRPLSAFGGCRPSDTWRCAHNATRNPPCTTRSRTAA